MDERKARAKGHRGKTLNERKDILVYKTAPFEKEITFVGPLSAVLYASSSAKDTDWFVRLVQINKDGEALPLGYGKIRARFRKSLAKPELLEPGKVYEYQLDLWHTGITIKEGSRLQVEVSSAAFPFFSRNLNTGGHNEMEDKFVKAGQTIYHSKQYPSHVLLPVIP
jgi:putative CocE/NonD family hydrolase